jgi:aspartate aminotransferase
MSKIQSHSTSNPTSIAQWAGLEALRLADDEVESMRRAFEERRDTIVRRLEGVPGVSCAPPVGAFYAFPNVSALFGSTPTGAPETASGSTLESALDVADYLLREARVAVVPGEAFGSRDHIRLSYACSISQIEEGMDRIAAAVAALR